MDLFLLSLVGLGITVVVIMAMFHRESPAEKWFRAFSARFGSTVQQLDPDRQLDVAMRLVEDSGPLLAVARETLTRFADDEDEVLAHKAHTTLHRLQSRRKVTVTHPPAIMSEMLARFTNRIDSVDDTIYRCSIDAAMELLFDEDQDIRLVARETFGPFGVFREYAA